VSEISSEKGDEVYFLFTDGKERGIVEERYARYYSPVFETWVETSYKVAYKGGVLNHVDPDLIQHANPLVAMAREAS
jgi:hypothetical protein